NNVAANLWGDQTEAAYGFKYFMLYLGNIKVPTHKGADTSVAGEYVVRNGNNMPLLEFNNNEIYGAAQGLTYWWLNKVESVTQPNPVETRVQGLKIWHVYNKAIYSYHATFVTFDGLIIRGDKPDDSVACCGKGWHGEDYPVGRITIRNSNIQGMRTGIKMSTYGTDVNTIEDSFFSNNVNVEFSTLRSTNGGAGIPPRVTIMRSLRFQPWPGADNKNILMTWDACCSSSQYNTTQRDEVYVYRYQDDVNDNFRAYYSIQGTQDVAGGRAPCGTTRSGIEGIVCTISGGSTLPSAPRNLRLVPPSQ
ncbi:MAG: hypothetical protein OEW19_00880, partial [Acidobacteriota bacterium]|nr:hypothetical protein [Acidobacteriota bacterium]